MYSCNICIYGLIIGYYTLKMHMSYPVHIVIVLLGLKF